MKINFATSGAGYARFLPTDAEGNHLEGYDSGIVFGDSTERKVIFPKTLAELNGKQIRMEIAMKDADLYAFKFETDVKWSRK